MEDVSSRLRRNLTLRPSILSRRVMPAQILRRSVVVAVVAAALGAPAVAAAQERAPVRLSIEDALRGAEAPSGAVAAARARARAAEQQVAIAKSGRLPQVTGTAAYSRTLASEFDGVFDSSAFSGGGMPTPPVVPCSGFEITPCTRNSAAAGGGVSLPFGQANTWRAGVGVQQLIFDGGRSRAAIDQARAGAASAKLDAASLRAQAVLAVGQAYYDAALAERQVEIARAGLESAEAIFADTQLSNTQGAVAEFDVVRAEVARDNQQNAVVQAEQQRDIAQLRLKQVLDLPLDAPVALTSTLDLGDAGEVDALVNVAREAAGLPAEAARTAVAQATENVRRSQAALRGAKADRLPQIGAVMDYGLVNYPEGFFPFNTDWRTNWTIGVNLSLPIFDGFRRRATIRAAEADVVAARATLTDAEQLAATEVRQNDATIAAAQATWQSSARTVKQAERAYQIAELRFQQGASSQLELVDARVQMQQAQLNQARSARDLRVARLRRALLPGLPFGGGF